MENVRMMIRPLPSFGEGYMRIYYGLRNFPILKRAVKEELISDKFKERLMLTVTGINSCMMCRLGHTEMAKKVGMTEEEIDHLFMGDFSLVPEHERNAMKFAEDVAVNRGLIKRADWNHLIEEYGQDTANGILASIQVIMLGNTFGNPLGSLMKRIKKNSSYHLDDRSSLGYELMMILPLIILLPIGIIHALIGSLFRLPAGNIVD